MPKLRKNACWVPGIVLTGLGAAWLIAGPLDPPAGPVSPTHKTLTEVEPRIAINAVNTPGSASALYEISTPGSYYLTGNIDGQSNRSAIRVNVSGVTIDLNGFALRGVSNSNWGIIGHPTGNVNVTILNGTIESWGRDGINLFTNCGNIRVEDVSVRHCAGRGIMVGLNSTVSDCAVFSCDDDGILGGDGAVVANCTVRACDADGINVSASSTISNCTAIENGGNGIDAFFGGSVTGCTALSNGNSGIIGGSDSVVTSCSSHSNGTSGIAAGPGSVISACSASDNAGPGFSGTNITVSDSRASSNTGDGFSLGDWSAARDCASIGNTGDGIRVGSHCRVIENHCYGNGAGSPVSTALHASGTDNRIERNHCEGADVGIDVDGAGNYIVGNTCTGNTIDWSFAAGNVHGPIIDRRTPGSPLVFGFAAVGTLGTGDPHANISH